MPGVLTNVVKGSMLANADTRLSQRDNDDYRGRLEDLKKWFVDGKAHVDHAKTRTGRGKDEKVARDEAQEKHTQVEFFGADPNKCFFPNMKNDSEDQIVRGAYIRAIDLALFNKSKEPKPIVSYWIINGREDGKPEAFEVFVAETDREVHVLLLTPRPVNDPAAPDSTQERRENMFVVATTERIQQIENGLPEGYSKIPVPLPGTQGVGCLQVVGY